MFAQRAPATRGRTGVAEATIAEVQRSMGGAWSMAGKADPFESNRRK